ncbi:CD63 antigen-like isoform X2 [Ostrinia furnacalis]|uniref:CD63 antigen-like isoform X2 n=1 Tax=Ostrinia furnacalis TaxID=93504 RepID=UPI00103D31BC|nr:CD63 antigen-like isoform X2 [Ostrinia furnacalis]
MTAPARNAQGMMFTKTETEYNMKSIRFLLLTITAMFVVIGIMMIVLGISVYGHYHSFTFFYDSVKSGRFMTPSVMCVFIGFVLLVVSTFGFMGSLKLSTCMVNFYALILLKILIVKLAIVILAFTTGSSALMGYIDIPVAQYPVDREIQTEIDALQAGIGCCGSNSFLDYIGMEFTDSHNTSVVTTEVDGDIVSMVVPRTCCAGNSQAICNRLRATGCKQAIANAISQNAAVLGVLGLSVMFILVLGITFALLLARCIRKLKSERAMMAWKIREQLIIARMEEERKNDPTLYITPAESSVA